MPPSGDPIYLNGRRKRVPTGSNNYVSAGPPIGRGNALAISAPMMATASSDKGKKRRLDDDDATGSRRTPKGKEKEKNISIMDKDRDSESVKDNRDRQKTKKACVACLPFPGCP